MDYPTSEVCGPEATGEQIKDLIDRYGSVLIEPVFKGGIGKKGKAGLIGRVSDVATAMREKERLFFVEHRVGNTLAKAEGVTFEGAIPAEHEVYVSITDDTRFRAPTLTITLHGGVDIEELAPDQIATIPLDALTGFKGFPSSPTPWTASPPRKKSSARWCRTCPSSGTCSTTTA